MLVAWLVWNFKKWSVSSLASCLRANPISLFRKPNHTLSETDSKRPPEMVGRQDKILQTFGALKSSVGCTNLPPTQGALTLAKSSAGSAGPPVKVSPVMGSSASPKTSWMTPHGKRWISTGTPPEVEQLAPSRMMVWRRSSSFGKT